MTNLHYALYMAYLVVGIELIIIAYIRNRYFKMNFIFSTFQVVFGGLLVLIAGIIIGSA